LLREDEAHVVGGALVEVVEDLAANFVHPDAFRPFIDAFEVAALLAIHLHECHDDFERLVLGLDQAEHLGALDVETGGAREVDLVA